MSQQHPANCPCSHCCEARRNSKPFNNFGQQMPTSPFSYPPHNPAPWSQPYNPQPWSQPFPGQPHKPYVSPNEKTDMFDTLAKKAQASKPTKRKYEPIDKRDLLMMKMYDTLKASTSDVELIEYWAFNIPYLITVADSDEYSHGYYHSLGAHLFVNNKGEVVISTPKVKLVVDGFNLDFVLKEGDKPEQLGEDVVSIISLIRDLIKPAKEESDTNDVADDTTTEDSDGVTLEMFYDYIKASSEHVVMTFAGTEFKFVAHNGYVTFYYTPTGLKSRSHGVVKTATLWSLIQVVVECTRRKVEGEDLESTANIVSVNRAINQAIQAGPNVEMDDSYVTFVNNVKSDNGLTLQFGMLNIEFKYNDEQLHVKIIEPNKFCQVKHCGKATTMNEVIQFIAKTFETLNAMDTDVNLPDAVNIRILLSHYI